MSGPEEAGGRRGNPFRPIALARYERPLEQNAPALLARRRPGLVIAAVVAAFIALLSWLNG